MAPHLPKNKQGIIGKIMSCLQNSWMFIFCTKCTSNPGGGGNPHMEGVGMLVGNFELNP